MTHNRGRLITRYLSIISLFVLSNLSLHARLSETQFNSAIDAFDQETNTLIPTDKKAVTQTIDAASKIYQSIYLTENTYRVENKKKWANQKIDTTSKIPVLLLAAKKRFASALDRFLQKISTVQKAVLHERYRVVWLNTVRDYLKKIETLPHIYDHYYGFFIHITRINFDERALQDEFLLQDRIIQELKVLTALTKEIKKHADKYGFVKDFVDTARAYFEARGYESIDLPIPEYRWYGPASGRDAHDTITQKKLAPKKIAPRLKHLLTFLKKLYRRLRAIKKYHVYIDEKYPHRDNVFFMMNIVKKEMG